MSFELEHSHEGKTLHEELTQVAHEAIKKEYGNSWEEHMHSRFMDELGNWSEGQSQENHEICPWPNINHVIDVIISATIDNIESSAEFK